MTQSNFPAARIQLSTHTRQFLSTTFIYSVLPFFIVIQFSWLGRTYQINWNLFFLQNFLFLKSRKRSLSDCQHEDLDNTRDSVLSDQSHFSATEANNEPELMIIDFEYCAYNYRGFDLANHFIEWMLDYSNKEFPFFFYKKEQYPNKEQQVWLVCIILNKSRKKIWNLIHDFRLFWLGTILQVIFDGSDIKSKLHTNCIRYWRTEKWSAVLHNGITSILDIMVICKCPSRHWVWILGKSIYSIHFYFAIVNEITGINLHFFCCSLMAN